VGQEDVVVQGEWLPVELLKLAGDLKVNIALSIYPPLVEESTQ
jgi:hypothetical protein